MGVEEKKREGENVRRKREDTKEGPADVEGCGGKGAKKNRSGRTSAGCGRKEGGCGSVQHDRWIERGNEDAVQME